MSALLQHSWILAGRTIRHHGRTPEVIVFGILQPVLFLLLFRYVFGGAVRVPSGLSYIDYLMAGILVQTVAFNSVSTGIGFAEDQARGMNERFRSLPIPPLSVPLGRVLATLFHNTLATTVLVLVGIAVGFRPTAGLIYWLAAGTLLLTFAFAISWLGVVIGMKVPTGEAAQAAGFLLIFPLVFASSGFVPSETMPGWLQAFVEHQPLSLVMDAERAWLLGGSAGGDVWGALAWCAAIAAAGGLVAAAILERQTRG